MKITRAFPRTAVLVVVALALATGWMAWSVSADDEEQHSLNTVRTPFYDMVEKYTEGWTYSFFLGGLYGDDEGVSGVGGLSAGQAAEYRSSESYAVLGLRMMFDGGANYSATKFMILGEDEFLAESNGSYFDRVLSTSARLERYPHRLTNDQAVDWDDSFVLAFDGRQRPG